MSLLPNLNITFNQHKLDTKIYTIEILETRNALNQIPEAHLVISGAEQGIYTLLSATGPGCEVVIKRDIAGKSVTLFTGEVIEQDVVVDNKKAHLTFQIAHFLHRLCRTLHSMVFSAVSDVDIIKTLLSAHGLSLSDSSGLTYEHEQLVQYQCSDWLFLLYRLHANNLWLTTSEDKDKVKLTLAKMPAGVVPAGRVLKREDSLQHAGIVNARWQRRQPPFNSDITISHWDLKNQEMSTPPLKPAQLSFASGGLGDVVKTGDACSARLNYALALEPDELQARIDAMEAERQLTAQQIHFSVWGKEIYHPGDVVSVEGFHSSLDGKVVISEVRHRITAERWDTDLIAGLEASIRTVPALTPEIKGIQIGIVAEYENKADPKPWYRLPIKVPVFDNKRELWARIALPHASDANSFGFYPNPGDEVIVAFMENDARYPVILGSVHNPIKQMPTQFNNTTFKTTKYITIGKGETQQSLIFNTKENTLSLIRNKNTFLMNQDSIEISAEERIYAAVKNKSSLLLKENTLDVKGASSVVISSKKIDLKR